ncbi:MAG TPA: helix-turn-helix domain-containing protein [Bryobacteraceae bacterium]|nr:helix-turn-helix domain-containing protein [Bryobacteraceae bacterium]
MEDKLYTVEQVADRLGLHVKTVRNYVREGRLKAVRIGKSYRIGASDLAGLTGQPVSSLDPEPVHRHRCAEVSSVVDIDAVSPVLSERVTNLLLGASHSRDGSEPQPLRVQTIYDAARGRLKVIVIGSIETTASILKIIRAMVEED